MCSKATSLLTIHFEGEADSSRLMDVQELSALISSNSGVEVVEIGESAPTSAKPVLASTIAIVGAVTGIVGLTLQALAIWKQDKPRYSVTVNEPPNTYTVENLSREDYLSTVKRLNATPPDVEIKITVTKK